MSAGKYTMTIEQGATFQLQFQYTDAAGTPIDITDYSGRLQIRPDYADYTTQSYAYVSSSIDADGTGLTIGSSGSIGLYISAAVTEGFDFDEGLYDLELQSGSYVTRLLEGAVKIRREVTRQDG